MPVGNGGLNDLRRVLGHLATQGGKKARRESMESRHQKVVSRNDNGRGKGLRTVERGSGPDLHSPRQHLAERGQVGGLSTQDDINRALFEWYSRPA